MKFKWLHTCPKQLFISNQTATVPVKGVNDTHVATLGGSLNIFKARNKSGSKTWHSRTWWGFVDLKWENIPTQPLATTSVSVEQASVPEMLMFWGETWDLVRRFRLIKKMTHGTLLQIWIHLYHTYLSSSIYLWSCFSIHWVTSYQISDSICFIMTNR